MTKLCPRGKAAAKRKFKVYPSAYANAYASKICAGKIKDPSGVKRKDFKGPKPAGKAMGGIIGRKKRRPNFEPKQDPQRPAPKRSPQGLQRPAPKRRAKPKSPADVGRKPMMGGGLMAATERLKRQGKMGGGMTMMPRATYGKGGGVCKKGMGRAYGKNS